MNESERSPANVQPKNPDMIEVPDWNKQQPESAEAGYEAGFDDNPFEVGKDIIVHRNGKDGAPGYEEGGWRIVDDDANVKIGKDQYMVGVVVEKTIDGEVYQKPIPLTEVYKLNPRNAPETAETAEKVPLTEVQEEIADEAIEASTGIENPSEVNPDKVLQQLTEGLSADDLLELRSYAEATDEVRDAQKEGRGEDSTYWQQIKGQSLRAMSARAQSVANRYAGYYNLTK